MHTTAIFTHKTHRNKKITFITATINFYSIGLLSVCVSFTFFVAFNSLQTEVLTAVGFDLTVLCMGNKSIMTDHLYKIRNTHRLENNRIENVQRLSSILSTYIISTSVPCHMVRSNETIPNQMARYN